MTPLTLKIAITVIVAIAFILFLTYLMNDVFKEIWKKRFELSIKNGIKNNKIENNDIYILAERWPIGKTNIQHCLNSVAYQYINDDGIDNIKLVRLREIISWHKNNDPFSELPENIKLQLIALQNLTDNSQEIVFQLAKSLSELYISNNRKNERERFISRLSLLFGSAGTIFTIGYAFM